MPATYARCGLDVTPLDSETVRVACPVHAGLFLEHFHEHKDKLRDVHASPS